MGPLTYWVPLVSLLDWAIYMGVLFFVRWVQR